MESYIKRKSREITNSIKLNQLLRKNLSSKRRDSTQILEEDNNYIDYFIEIGVKPEIFKEKFLYESSINELTSKLKLEIISKFPENNKKSIIIDDNIISQVFPHGLNIVKINEKPDPVFYSIISDNHLYSSIYKYKYYSCLIIYESIGDYKKLYNIYYNKEKDENEINYIYNQFYIPKCLCIVSVHPCIDKHEAILDILYQNMIKGKFNKIFLNDLIGELVLKIPKIPKGYKMVLLNILKNQVDLTENKLNEYPSVHIDLSKLFAMFKINVILDIFKYILCEGNLIFFGTKIYDITTSILSFLFLLSPLEYQCQVVSILPKENYFFIESDIPYILGINERYSPDFFIQNKIDIKQRLICIVDLEEKNLEIIGKNNNNMKEYPDIPKHLKEGVETSIQQYYKYLINSAAINLENINNKIKNNQENNNFFEYKINEKNEQYQLIFYKFMISLLQDYPKYLSKNISAKDDTDIDINNIIDMNSYLNSFNLVEKEFYKKIFKTKMFKEFIVRRCYPKNSMEKIKSIFFEEKINQKIAEGKVFGKAKIMDQNKLLLSKEYDYSSQVEIIDISPSQNLSYDFIELCKDKNFINEECLKKGYIIEEDTSKDKDINITNNKYNFIYYIFPSLFNSESKYNFNTNNLISPPLLYKQIDLINAKMVKISNIKFFENKILKKNYAENDLYICYIILWCLSCWYTEESEKDYRFGEMLEILDKIKYQKSETFQLIIESLNKWKYKDDDILYVYMKYINNKLNPSWFVFDIIFDIIQKKQKRNNKVNLIEQLLNLEKNNKKVIQSKKSKNKELFSKRVFRGKCNYEENIISDNIKYICYTKCVQCGKVIDIGKICHNLSLMNIKNYNGVDMVKCYNKDKKGKSCEYYNCLKLRFRYGIELYNHKINKLATSKYFNIPLLSPSTLKEKLLNISKYYKEFDDKISIELFKRQHEVEFWNSIWYFYLKDIDISFIFPYEHKESLKKNLNIKDNTDTIEGNKIKIKTFSQDIIIERNNQGKKYINEDLCIQIVHQFAFIKKIGMISYKDIYLYEDNINYNELPLIFMNSNLEENISNRESTLKRSITSRDIHEVNYNESDSEISNASMNSINTPKKFVNYNNFLKQNSQKGTQILVNSSSSPMLINNINNKKKY